MPPMNVRSSYQSDPRLVKSEGDHESDPSHPPLRDFKSGYDHLMKNNWSQIPDGSPKQPKLKKPSERAPAHSGLDGAKPPQPAKPYVPQQKSQQQQAPQKSGSQPQQKSQQPSLNTPSTSPQKSQPPPKSGTQQAEEPEAQEKSTAVFTEKITMGRLLYAHQLVAMAQVLANLALTNKVQMDMAMHSGATSTEDMLKFFNENGAKFRMLYKEDPEVKDLVDNVKPSDKVSDPKYAHLLEFLMEKMGG